MVEHFCHKTGQKKAADLFLPDWGYEKLLRYKRLFRPKSAHLKKSSSHFFNLQCGKTCDQKGSGLISRFQEKWGLEKITNTDHRHSTIGAAALKRPEMMTRVAEAACHSAT